MTWAGSTETPFSLGTWTEEETLEVDSKSNYSVIEEGAKAARNHGTYKLIKLIDRTEPQGLGVS